MLVAAGFDSAPADACGLMGAAANATPQANKMDSGPIRRAMERMVTINTSADTGRAANCGRCPLAIIAQSVPSCRGDGSAQRHEQGIASSNDRQQHLARRTRQQ